MSKQIIKGCRAVIVNSDAGNDGIIVTVGEFVGEMGGWQGGSRWRINRILKGNKGGSTNTMQVHQLLRIDDDSEELTTWQSIEQLTNWNPNKVGIDAMTEGEK